jgi:hypothetical protein
MTLAKAKLALSITFIVLASFTIVTYDRQNMFIIQATDLKFVFPTLCKHQNFQLFNSVFQFIFTVFYFYFCVTSILGNSSHLKCFLKNRNIV